MGRGLGLWNDLFPDLHWTILNERVRQEQNRVWRGDVGGRQEDASERLAAGRARRGDAGGRLADGWRSSGQNRVRQEDGRLLLVTKLHRGTTARRVPRF